MRPCPLGQVAAWSGGRLIQGNPNLMIHRLHTDTRSLQGGDCFVALRGPNFDGHDFIPQLPDRGAVAALVSASGPRLVSELGVVEVADTLEGLQKFATAYRRSLSAQTIGVTGSSGKTSTKELIAAILRVRFQTQATQGNLNNHLGVPLTLLSMNEKDAFGVIEMGMNHPGEIAPLAQMAAPTIGVISSIGTAHIEFFKDREGIALEKAELIKALPANGVAILNCEDEGSRRIAPLTSARVVWVGQGINTSWWATDHEVTNTGLSFKIHHGAESARVKLPVYNRVMIGNALLAAAVGDECGLTLPEIVQGLESVKLPGARMQVLQKNGTFLINDAYNANPNSMCAALIALREFPGVQRRMAVLGSMGELGQHAAILHYQVGEFVAQQKIEILIAVGPNADAFRQGALALGMKPENTEIALDAKEAMQIVKQRLHPGDVVLSKGSHFMGMERIAELWVEKENR